MPDRSWVILVVEAEQRAQGRLAHRLQEDYQMLATTSGQAAFDILADNEVDLVLCDLVLPDMSGVEFFSRIRGDALPLREEVKGACEILGLDPLYLANEGKVVAVVAAEDADQVLAAMQAHPAGADQW